MEREIWIDWAKTIGIAVVVFCHIPQDDSVFRTFCCFMQMPLFFFISGYLHRNQKDFRTSVSKYTRSIIIPYVILQMLNYPYWLFRYYSEHGYLTGWLDCVVFPFGNCLIGNPIAGPTWYVCSILLLKLLTDALHRLKYENVYICSILLFALVLGFCINHPPLDHQINFTLLSTVNFLPFFYLGYYVQRYLRPFHIPATHGVFSFMLSVTLIFLEEIVPFPNRFLFYVVGFLTVIPFLALMQRITVCPHFVETISRGTILVLGIHWMCIGTTNFTLEHLLYVQDIHYSVVISILLAVLFCTLLYPFIVFCSKHFKAALGGR